MNDDGHLAPARSAEGRKRGIATEARDKRRLSGLHQAVGTSDAAPDFENSRWQRPGFADIRAGSGDFFLPVGWKVARIGKATGITDQADLPAARTHLFSKGCSREHMPACPAGRDNDERLVSHVDL